MTGSVNLFIFIVIIWFWQYLVCFSLFFCRLGMPPKRSKRLRNPSARAVVIAAGGEPPRKKSRRAALQPTPDNQGSSSVVSTDQSPTLSSAASVEPQPLSLLPGVLDQLVARVADEVTRHLSPPEDTCTTPISNTSMPSALSEVALVSTSLCTSQCCPGAWYISCNSRNGWSHSAGVFKHHANIIVR